MLEPRVIGDTSRKIEEQPKAEMYKVAEVEPITTVDGKSRFDEIENAINALADAVTDISETLEVKPYTIKALDKAVMALNRGV